MDLGPCNKIHEAALKADFELASKNRDFGYDIDVSVKSLCRLLAGVIIAVALILNVLQDKMLQQYTVINYLL